MVIQCSSCDTRFKLADDKIKEGGVKVRCSKCKEVFTVMPPEEETAADSSLDFSPDDTASESTTSDWSDLNSDNDSSDETDDSSSEGGIDWSNMGGDEEEEEETPSDTASAFSFGDDADSSSDDSIAFDDEESDSDSESIDFGDSADESPDDDIEFDDAVGEGANDEFSFDDEAPGSLDVSDDSPDFDWDGSAEETPAEDFDFGGADDSGDGDLDFSSVDLESAEDSPPPVPMAQPEPAAIASPEAEKPLSAKGPQRGTAKKRGRKQRKKKQAGPMRGILMLILFLLILVGAHAGILYWKGYWQGDPAELANLDHETVHIQVYKVLYSELTGGKIVKPPAGEITILGMSGRFVENATAGTLFVVEGQVKNEFKETRSAIAVRGVLYNQAGKQTMRKKVYCGNKLSEKELQTLSLESIQERLDNQFGDSLSNLDVSPDVVLPYTIVFGKLPDNLAEFNVEIAESAPGSKE